MGKVQKRGLYLYRTSYWEAMAKISMCVYVSVYVKETERERETDTEKENI